MVHVYSLTIVWLMNDIDFVLLFTFGFQVLNSEQMQCYNCLQNNRYDDKITDTMNKNREHKAIL